MKLTNKKGQSLFELMMAVFITAVTLVALLSLVSSSVSNSTFSRDRNEASRYTSEAAEWLRSERDENWANLTTHASVSGSVYCLNNLSWDQANTCLSESKIVDTKFARQVTLVHDPITNTNTVEANIVTSWSDSSGTHESRTVVRLTDWRSI